MPENLLVHVKANLLTINEQYHNKDDVGWYGGALGTAAIWIQDVNPVVAKDDASERRDVRSSSHTSATTDSYIDTLIHT